MTYIVQANYRAPTAEDVGFIYSSWLRSFRDMSDWARLIPGKVYFSHHKRVIERILRESGVVIAANPENLEQIFGYAVYQPSRARLAVVHFVYVKHVYRKMGIGRSLFDTVLRVADHDPDLPAVYTHYTTACKALSDKWNAVYNPYLLGALFADDQAHEPQAS